MSKSVLTNENGVNIINDGKHSGHYYAENAKCWCGEDLIVAPAIYRPRHQKGDPEMRCSDFGIHAYMFHELEQGVQKNKSKYQNGAQDNE